MFAGSEYIMEISHFTKNCLHRFIKINFNVFIVCIRSISTSHIKYISGILIFDMLNYLRPNNVRHLHDILPEAVIFISIGEY